MLWLSLVLTVCTAGAVVFLQSRGHRPLVVHSRPPSAAEVQVEFAWPPLAKPASKPGSASIKTVSDGSVSDPVGTWMPVQFQRQLQELVRSRLGGPGGAFGAESIKAVGEALEASGWFDGRPRVERRAGHRLLIDGRWRVPAAFVRWEGRDYLIAWDGRLLPPVYEPGQVNLRAIVNVSTAPPKGPDGSPDFKSPWPGEGVGAAVELLGRLSGRPWYSQVRGIDLGEFDKDRRLVILTTFGTRVVWGGPVRRPLPGESTTAGKLEKLDLLYRDFQRLDAGRPAVDISLQSPPLEIDISASASARVQGADASVTPR